MEKKSSVISVRVPDSLLASLTFISNKLNVSLSLLVCGILTSFCDEYTKGNK